MAKNKKIIEESFDKMKSLVESRINEAPVGQTIPAATQPSQVAPAAPAAKPAVQDTAARDQKISKNIDVTMDQAMAKLVQGLPALLGNFSKTGGDKDGVLDAPGVYDNNNQDAKAATQTQGAQPIQEGMMNEITFDEGVFMNTMEDGELNEAGLLSLAVSAPAIMKYGGKAAEWAGKKMNSAWLQKWGGKAAKAGEKLHHKYVGLIEKALKPFMPNATPDQLHKASNAIFMGGVAILFAGGLASPGVLTAVKGTELGEIALSTIPKILPRLGFA